MPALGVLCFRSEKGCHVHPGGAHAFKHLHDPDLAGQDVHWSAGAMGYFPTYSLGALTKAYLLSSLRLQKLYCFAEHHHHAMQLCMA